MKKRDNFVKIWLGIAIELIGVGGFFACIIIAAVYCWRHPDMTDMRRLMEFPHPYIGSLISYVMCLVGHRMSKGIW